ncbi:hypothetical protein CANCADRAFT_56131 [Tortispora caseinolytica NRRL Y-17796]|uniref:Uncharacterized protein n=1 Tax=Tortispora caseinolytica NRRL Y-17796 TaxID=767744 RepID=A0A1E4TL35_9ASCO|nr:hypothetical protein CANCADRAFT_56131 [Tortispora caseinolytica NRRL Y-17796]
MFPYLDRYVETLAAALKLDKQSIRFLLCFVLSYPFAAVLPKFPRHRIDLKCSYIIAVGLFFMCGIFSMFWGAFLMLFNGLWVYLLLLYKPDNNRVPWIVLVVLMSMLFLIHLRKEHLQDLGVSFEDYSGTQMVLVMKLTSLSWSVYDGTRPIDSLENTQRKETVLQNLPPLLHYYAYIFFFPLVFTGPSFDYAVFRDYLTWDMFKDEGYKIKPDKKYVASRFLESVFWIIVNLFCVKLVNLAIFNDPSFYQDNSFFKCLYYYKIGLMQTKSKYYIAWTFGEGSSALSGLGYNGKDKNGKPKWDRMKNCDPVRIELADSSRYIANNWNSNTGRWLRNSVYLRATPKGKKPTLATMTLTFVVSAIWHGSRAGYYGTFLSIPLLLRLHTSLFSRKIKPFFLTPDGSKPTKYKKYYDIFTIIGTNLCMEYIAMGFPLLKARPLLIAWRGTYFYVHVIALILLFVDISPVGRYLAKQVKKYQSQSKKDQ